MTRKAAGGRKTSVRTRTGAAQRQARTTTRTGRKTSSARATKAAAQRTPAKRAAAPAAPPRTAGATQPRGTAADPQAMHEPLAARGHAAGEQDIKTAQHEDDEDMDWLGEDEDPRSQIVEDDDDWEPGTDDEW